MALQNLKEQVEQTLALSGDANGSFPPLATPLDQGPGRRSGARMLMQASDNEPPCRGGQSSL